MLKTLNRRYRKVLLTERIELSIGPAGTYMVSRSLGGFTNGDWRPAGGLLPGLHRRHGLHP